MIEYRDDDNLEIRYVLPDEYIEQQTEKLKIDMLSFRRAIELALARGVDNTTIELFDMNWFRASIICEALEKIGISCKCERRDNWARFFLDMRGSDMCQTILSMIEILDNFNNDKEKDNGE